MSAGIVYCLPVYACVPHVYCTEAGECSGGGGMRDATGADEAMTAVRA